MAQLLLSQGSFESEHLRQYLPHNLAEALTDASGDAELLSAYLIEAFVHLAAARYTITTYLPRLLVQQLLEERRQSPFLYWMEGSLLFADLSGSTALAERLGMLGREGTELVTEFLNDIFSTMIQVVEEFGGDLMAFGGDALLVYFGDDRHPRTAARAALALQSALHGYERAVPGIGTFPMHLHIGVESGSVAFASAGGGTTRHFCMLGATVNGVATAEGYAGPGEVVVGPHAAAVLQDFGMVEEVGPGFLRLMDMLPPRRPHEPLPDTPVVAAMPEEAIPQILDDLHQISAYVSPVLLERILADPQRPQVEADLRPVSVLFAQVVGLEALAQAVSSEQASAAFQAYVGTMQEALDLFGGVVNKLDVADEGIKLVAIFGAPAAYEDHAERAALAALEMQERISQVQHHITGIVAPGTALNLRQRVGLNLGTVFAGNVGSPSRKEYTVMGDAVNVAARVMSKAAWGEVWCSDAALEAITDRVVWEPRGEVMVKGKSAPLPLFRVLARQETSIEQNAADEGPLVGREHELEWLGKHLHAAQHGAGRALRIAGDAGVGKSRLTAALVAEARAKGFQVVPASCFSYTSGIPYAAWGEWLKALCGINSGDGNAQRIDKLAARLARLGPGMDEWLPVLGDLARLDIPENRLTRGLDPKMRQTRRFELLEQLLLRAADEGPILALFEDLHWGDSISLDLWQRITSNLEGRPVLLVGVHRPSLDIQENEHTHVLQLRELSPEESNIMVTSLLAGSAALPDSVVKQVVGRAAGNPLFLNELLRAVQVRMQLSQVQSDRDAQLAIEDLPDSLNGLLLSRIDRLDEGSRNLLRVASVIGQRIPFGVLRSLQPVDQQALVQLLVRLDEQEMTQLERVEPERVHVFRHALLQEVAYQSMLYARRRELHGRIGAYLERRYGDDLDDYYGLLAHHYRLSDRRDKAVEYLLKAGHAASAVYANEEAVQYYCWALELLIDNDADPRLWEARDALGEVYATVGRYDEALQQHAAILASPSVTPNVARKALRKRGSVLEKQGQYVLALEELDRAMTIAQSDTAGISALAIPRISADIALVYKRQGNYDKAIAACEEGLNHLRRDPRTRADEQIEARLHSELGGIYGMRGDYPRARQHFEHSLHIREMIDDLPGVVASNNNLGYLWQLQSEYEKALEHYHVAEEIARKINLRYALIHAETNAAYALLSLGDYAKARSRCLEALTIARDVNAQHDTAQIYNTLGVISYHQGDYNEATAAYDRAISLNQRLGSSYQEANALMNLAVVLNAQGRFFEAAEVAEQALNQAKKLNAPRLQVEALNALSEAMFGQRTLDSAQTYAREALELATHIQSKYDTGIAHRQLGQVLALQGEPFTAHFEHSGALFQEIKDRFELARTWAAYGAALLANENAPTGDVYLKQAYDAFIAVGAHGEIQRVIPFLERSI